MLGDCYPQPMLHVWWDDDDVDHAAATGQPKPSGWCGCAFCGAPAVGKTAAENASGYTGGAA